MDALAPSNFLMTNPQVLRETLTSGGQNLVQGLNNLLADIEKGGGQLRISMTDESAFQLGRNVATTPGKVVHRSAAHAAHPVRADDGGGLQAAAGHHPALDQQVLHPRPAREELLHPLGSEQGHTVFVVSWVNPDARLAQKGFDDYMREGRSRSMRSGGRPTSGG